MSIESNLDALDGMKELKQINKYIESSTEFNANMIFESQIVDHRLQGEKRQGNR